jgi:hypothetical protein
VEPCYHERLLLAVDLVLVHFYAADGYCISASFVVLKVKSVRFRDRSRPAAAASGAMAQTSS